MVKIMNGVFDTVKLKLCVAFIEKEKKTCFE